MQHGSSDDTSGFGGLDSVLPGDGRIRRRVLAGVTARLAGTTAALFVLYAVVPVPDSSEGATIAALIAILVAFLAIVGWQIRSITRSPQPILRAIEVVALSLGLLVVVFSYIYLSISDANSEAFSEPLSRIDAAYFTVSIIGTVGFGDIAAASEETRLLVTVQMLLNILLIAGFARIVVLATRTGLRRRDQLERR